MITVTSVEAQNRFGQLLDTVQREPVVGAVETAADFFKLRAGGAKPADLLLILDKVGNEPPRPGDEMHDR